jgi:transposase
MPASEPHSCSRLFIASAFQLAGQFVFRQVHGCGAEIVHSNPATKLKFIKRQFYGRTKIDLLEAKLVGANDHQTCT